MVDQAAQNEQEAAAQHQALQQQQIQQQQAAAQAAQQATQQQIEQQQAAAQAAQQANQHQIAQQAAQMAQQMLTQQQQQPMAMPIVALPDWNGKDAEGHLNSRHHSAGQWSAEHPIRATQILRPSVYQLQE